MRIKERKKERKGREFDALLRSVYENLEEEKCRTFSTAGWFLSLTLDSRLILSVVCVCVSLISSLENLTHFKFPRIVARRETPRRSSSCKRRPRPARHHVVNNKTLVALYCLWILLDNCIYIQAMTRIKLLFIFKSLASRSWWVFFQLITIFFIIYGRCRCFFPSSYPLALDCRLLWQAKHQQTWTVNTFVTCLLLKFHSASLDLIKLWYIISIS